MTDDERWRNLGFEETQALFESPSQNARVWTEGWVAHRLFCPNCGAASLNKYPNNRPVADFLCGACHEDYELKSQKGRFGRKVNDGAYQAMTQRLLARDNPNLILMNYDRAALRVINLIVVPKHFFTPEVIEPRRPLGPTARRAGWQGCNILLQDIPEAGKIWLVREGELLSREHVLETWRRTLFLRDEGIAARGWLIEVMRCRADRPPGVHPGRGLRLRTGAGAHLPRQPERPAEDTPATPGAPGRGVAGVPGARAVSAEVLTAFLIPSPSGHVPRAQSCGGVAGPRWAAGLRSPESSARGRG